VGRNFTRAGTKNPNLSAAKTLLTPSSDGPQIFCLGVSPLPHGNLTALGIYGLFADYDDLLFFFVKKKKVLVSQP